MKKVILSIISLCLVLGVFFYNKMKSEKKVGFDEVSTSWLQVMEEINTNWEGGVVLNDPQVVKNCSKLSKSFKNVPKELLACRSLPFYCFYKERKNNLVSRGQKFSYKVEFPTIRSDLWSMLLKVTKNEAGQRSTKSFFIADKCRKASIPKISYNHGKFIDPKNTWHPGDVDYWVDKFLVRNIDFDFWSLQSGEALNITSNPFSPVKVSKLKEMKDFCRYKKAQVLTSKMADAITYYRPKKSGKLNIRLSPYPFSVRASSIRHFKISKGENEDYIVTRKDCDLIYSKDCLLQKRVYNPTLSLGWSGVAELLGGPLEYVHNELYPRRNIVLSSYYFPYVSFVHRAGIRGYWDGENVFESNFNFFTEAPQNNKNPFHVSFRCMGVEN